MPFIRFTLSQESETRVRNFVARICSEFPGMVSQENPRAGLGGQPFHISVVGNLHPSAQLLPQHIINAVEAIARSVRPFILGEASFHGNKLEFKDTQDLMRSLEMTHNIVRSILPQGCLLIIIFYIDVFIYFFFPSFPSFSFF